jgi:C4-dicarboxylate transporter DctQ subunit
VFNRLLDRLEEGLIATLMGAATLLTFSAVVLRYFGGGITWAQELTIYLFIWMAKFGAAYGVRTGIHVGVDVLVRKLRPRRQRRLIAFALGVGAFFTAVVALLGTKFVYFSYRSGQTSPDLEWPMWVVYLAVPLGSALMCYRFLQVLTAFLRGRPLPGHHYGEREVPE